MVRPERFELPTFWSDPEPLVPSAGLEPTTSWSEAKRSIQLSYEGK